MGKVFVEYILRKPNIRQKMRTLNSLSSAEKSERRTFWILHPFHCKINEKCKRGPLVRDKKCPKMSPSAKNRKAGLFCLGMVLYLVSHVLGFGCVEN